MEIQMDRYYTLKELGNYLFSSRTWERRIREGEVTYLKTGIILVKGEWIEQYIEKKTVRARGCGE